jgi:hypothetical protein
MIFLSWDTRKPARQFPGIAYEKPNKKTVKLVFYSLYFKYDGNRPGLFLASNTSMK